MDNKMKLSEAMRKGLEIAKENNIEQGNVLLFSRPFGEEITKACALGMAIIGLQSNHFPTLPLEYVSTGWYPYIDDAFGIKNVRSDSLTKEVKERLAKIDRKTDVATTYPNVSSQVWIMNDNLELPVEEIADILEQNGY